MSSVQVPDHQCLNCSASLAVVSDPDGTAGKPEPGSLTVCGYCGAIMALDLDLTCRPLTQQEIADVKADPEMQRHLAKLVGIVDYLNEPRQ